MRRLVTLVVLACLASSCGGRASIPTSTTDPRIDPAAEFAFSARRALEGTRFEELGDDGVVRSILEVCDALASSDDPDETVLAAVASIDAPAGEPIDDEIMAVVLSEGADAVCPDAVDAAALRAWEAAPPEERFLAAVASVAPVLDEGVTDDGLLAAGRALCAGLDAGESLDDAVVTLFADLFGIEGVTVDEIAAGEAGEKEGLLAGGVIGSAVSFLCPEYHDAVTAYLERLSEENSE